MNRIEELLAAIETRLTEATGDGGGPLFREVARQLDPYDLEDVTRESFRAPAARVLFTSAKPLPRPSGALDLETVVTICVITKRSGGVSADAAALDLALAVAQLVADRPMFGLIRLRAARETEIKVAFSEKSSDKGLAIALVMLRATLIDVVTPRAGLAGPLGLLTTTVPVSASVNEQTIVPEESS